MGMDLLQTLFSGQQKRQEYTDFIGRYDQGPPYTGIAPHEAVNRYHEVAQHAPPDVYERSAYDAFSRMSPVDRRQFGGMLRQQVRRQGLSFPDVDRDGIDDRFEDPRHLARVTTQMHRQQPNLLGQLVGGGGTASNPLAKAALGGIAAMVAKQFMGR